MFLNLTNHPSSQWHRNQRAQASYWGEIIDLPFPSVDAQLDMWGICVLGDILLREIVSLSPDAVLCQGEITLCYYLVTRLHQSHITVLAACSRRDSCEIIHEDGTSVKEARFVFEQFREYHNPFTQPC